MAHTSHHTGQVAPSGDWGGEHISLRVGARESTFELDCAHGRIDGPLSLDGGGSFEVEGSYVRERGGPERPGQQPETHPARFTGRVGGRRMTFRIVLADSGQEIGTFSLELGREPMITKCL